MDSPHSASANPKVRGPISQLLAPIRGRLIVARAFETFTDVQVECFHESLLFGRYVIVGISRAGRSDDRQGEQGQSKSAAQGWREGIQSWLQRSFLLWLSCCCNF